MDGYRCPKCHTLSYPGLMGFPRCHRCHEQLRQCRYCSHQNGGICRLDPATRPRLRQEEGKPFCDAFESRLVDSAPEGPLRRPFSPAARVTALSTAVALVLAILVAIAATRDVLTPQIEPEEAYVDVIDGRVSAGFVISSPDADAGDRTFVTLGVDPAIERFFVIESPSPRPLGERTSGPKEYRYRLEGSRPLRVSIELLRRAEVPAPPGVPLVLHLQAGREVVLASATTVVRTGEPFPASSGRLP